MLEKILSGGQTGVDRAALDVAIELGFSHGGWCPAGRDADGGVIPEKYQLTETSEIDHTVRSEYNVRDADATMMLYRGKLHGGTAYAIEMAQHLAKPVIAINLDQASSLEEAIDWIRANQVKILFVGGQRETTNSGIYFQSRVFLNSLFLALK